MATNERADTSVPGDSFDELLLTLADRRRRDVIWYFRDAPADVATLHDIVAYVLDRHDDVDDADHVATVLHHGALPKLARRDVVDYDPRSRTARYRGDPLIERCLGLLADAERIASRD